MLLSTHAPVAAQVSININVPGLVQIALPSRYQPARVCASRVWVPGYLKWNRKRSEWRTGYSVDDRPDERYVAGVQARGGREWRKERWARRERVRGLELEHDFDRDRGHDREDDRGGGYHCRPGQTKKANC